MIDSVVIRTDDVNTKAISIFATGIGLSIVGYLNPLHSPIGHDFLVNAISFVLISLSLGILLIKNARVLDLKAYSISVYTWLSLAVLLCFQPLLSTIRYSDALIFPVGSLILIILVSLTASNILNTPLAKRQFLNQLSGWLYLTLILTFVIQVLQAMNYAINIGGWGITRVPSIADRLDGNFGQVNHTAYTYLLGICCIIYQLQTSRQANMKRSYQLGLLILLAVFAVGISVTKSRAVILMLIASVVVYFFCQQGNAKRKLAWCGSILVIFAISYGLGGVMMATLSPAKIDATGGIGRIVSSGVDSQRMALTHKAIMIFKDYPITGIGWRNFAVGAIPHVDEMRYVTFSDNSHMVFTQIASELGVIGLLCLVPVTWLVLRSLHNRHSAESAMALAFVIATSIYACFEYPLWYFRYLVVFAIFLAMLEQKNQLFKTDNPKLPKILGSICLIFTLISSYYVYQFWTHKYLFWYSHPNLTTDTQSGKKTVKTASIFGFLNYNDMDLTSVVEVSPDLLPQKLALFDRVIIDESSPYNLVSYGQLLSFNGQYDKALNTFKTACRLEENKNNCGEIENVLRQLADQYPQHFQTNYRAYQAWLSARNLQ